MKTVDKFVFIQIYLQSYLFHKENYCNNADN